MKILRKLMSAFMWIVTPCKSEQKIREKKEKIENLYHKW